MSSIQSTARIGTITTKRVVNVHYVPVAPDSPSVTSQSECAFSAYKLIPLQSALFVSIAVTIGITPVVQGGINIALSEWIGYPLKAAFINSIIGTLFLSLTLCKTSLIDSKSLIHNIVTECKSEKRNLFVFFNGFLGVFYICSIIYIVPIIGFGLYTISLVSGQIIMSTLIDHYGLIWSSPRRLSPFNLIGPLLAIAGCVAFQSQLYLNPENDVDPNPDDSSDIMVQILCVCCAAAAGICSTVQSALNRRLTEISGGSTYQSTFISFCVGTSVLVVLNVVDMSIRRDFDILSQIDSVPNWYIFCGGMIGAFNVSMFIMCPSYIGFVTTYLCSIFGSMLVSVVFDYFGAFGVAVEDKGNVLIFEIIGILCVLVGAIIVNLKRNTVESSVAIKIDDHCDPV